MVSQIIRQTAKDYKCSLKEICEQEYFEKKICDYTVEYKFIDGSTIVTAKTQEDC